MASSSPRSAPGLTAFDGVVVGVVAAAAILAAALWVGGQAASVMTGHGWASGSLTAGVEAVTMYRSDPGAAWTSPMPGPVAYWSITVGSIAVLVGAAGVVGMLLYGRSRTRRKVDRMAARPGMATPREIGRTVGRKALLANATELRPTLGRPAKESDLGWRWGRARGVDVYTSVRDSVVLLGPSGAGKGVYVVNSRVLDAPGAVVVTSTRPDVFAITMTARARVGPVGVIAADGSVDGLPQVVAWSPIIGCRDGRVAAARAQVLAAGSSTGVEDSSFWQGWSEKVIKALLHAAAWGEAGIDELWRWSQSAAAAKAALSILQRLEAHPPVRGRSG